MKTVILAGEGAISFMRSGWSKALQHIGYGCATWNPRTKAAFDMFHELEPEFLILGSWELDRALVKCIKKHPDIKLMLWGANWGSLDSDIDRKTDTVLMATKEEKLSVEELKEVVDLRHIFTYYHQNWANVTHDKWREIGLEPIGIPLAADVIDYPYSKPSEALACDIAFVGGYWPYKSQNLNEFLLPLCHPDRNLNVKIFGWGNWPVAQHLGEIDTRHVSALFASAAICPNIFEPLSIKYGFDVNERSYKILSSGGFCISQYVESAAKDIFTKNEVLFTHTKKDFDEAVEYALTRPLFRAEYATKGRKSVYHNHTYFHRIDAALSILNIEYGREKLKDTLTELSKA